MACLVCVDGDAVVGTLCRICAQQVPAPAGMIPEHVYSNVSSTEAEAWLVDGYGVPHALCTRTLIGRNVDRSDLVVLSISTSQDHLELKKSGDTWTLRDVGSRNGTFVDNVRTTRAPLPEKCVIRIGEVGLWFLSKVVDQPAAVHSPETQDISTGIVCYTLDAGRVTLRVVGNSAVGTGGTLMWRSDEGEWTNHTLSPLEYQLLRMLCVRAVAEAGSPAAVKGCVPTPQLVRDLAWQSDYANDENVRQLVKRLRETIKKSTARGIIAAAPGLGYYVACPVRIG